MRIIQNATVEDNYNIKVVFGDGRAVLYDMKPLIKAVLSFRDISLDEDQFHNIKISNAGDMIFWTDTLNLDANSIWENGILIENNRTSDTKRMLAYRLRLAREQVGMTQKELASITGIYQADISKIERGLGNPSIDTLSRLAEGLNVELNIEFHMKLAEGMQSLAKGRVSTLEEVMGRTRKRWEERGISDIV